MKLLAPFLIFLAVASPALADYRFERKEGAPTLLVFVHGFVGNGTDTWTNEETTAYWPAIVSKDPLFDRADILVYDYPSSFISQNITINELAKRMEIELRSSGVNIQAYEEVLFVAHSMGGLVVRQYLLANPDIANHVKGLFLFATPMKGS
ncbi:MAG: alpha/beta fold hydrolase, partial [Pseudomonadota bacterium]|nr:alpha/beta fold hydrolase [Pseudomonadota bacterium]